MFCYVHSLNAGWTNWLAAEFDLLPLFLSEALEFFRLSHLSGASYYVVSAYDDLESEPTNGRPLPSRSILLSLPLS